MSDDLINDYSYYYIKQFKPHEYYFINMSKTQKAWQQRNLTLQSLQNKTNEILSYSNKFVPSQEIVQQQVYNQNNKKENYSHQMSSKQSNIRFIEESIKEVNYQDHEQQSKQIIQYSGNDSTKINQAVQIINEASIKSQRKIYEHKRINTQLSNEAAKTQANEKALFKKEEKAARQLLNQQQKYNNRNKPSNLRKKTQIFDDKLKQPKQNSIVNYERQNQINQNGDFKRNKQTVKNSIRSKTIQSNKNIPIFQGQGKVQKNPNLEDKKNQTYTNSPEGYSPRFNFISDQPKSNKKNIQQEFNNRIAAEISQERASFNVNSQIYKHDIIENSPKNQRSEKRSISKSRQKYDGKSIISLSINASSANQRIQIKKLNNKVNSLQNKLRKLQQRQNKQIKNGSFQNEIQNGIAKIEKNQVNAQLASKNISFRVGRTQPVRLNLQSNAINVNKKQDFDLKVSAVNIDNVIKQKKQIKQQSVVQQLMVNSSIKKNLSSEPQIKQKDREREIIKKITDNQPKWIINDLYFNNLGQMIDTNKKMSVGILDKREKYSKPNAKDQSETSWFKSAQLSSSFQRSIPIRRNFQKRQPAIFKCHNQSLKTSNIGNSNRKSQSTQQYNQQYQPQIFNQKVLDNYGETQQPLGLLRNQISADLPKLAQQILKKQNSNPSKINNKNRLQSAIRRRPAKKIGSQSKNHKQYETESQFTQNPQINLRSHSQNTQFQRSSHKYHQQLFKANKCRQKSLKLKGIQLNNVLKYKSKKKLQDIYGSVDYQENGFKQQFDPLQNSNIEKSKLSFASGKKVFQLDFKSRRQQIPDDNDEIKIPEKFIQPKRCKLQSLNFQIHYHPPNQQMTVQELLTLGRNVFRFFNVDIQKQERQNNLKIIKYRNCVNFNVEGSHNQLIWHYSGKLYFGGWEIDSSGQGQKHGQGVEYMPNKYIFKGQFYNGKRNGTGILETINSKGSSIYDGQWIHGSKHGDGKYFQKQSGAYYQGEWKNNKRQGFGFLRTSEIQFYVGTFHNSIKHGYGSQFFGNGDKYQGQFKQGKFHGKGRYQWQNGSFYEGKFQNGNRHGFGHWRSSKKGGEMYRGQYRNDKKEGKGIYIWSNGAAYQGQFSNDHKNGIGKIIDQYGRQTKGLWLDGNMIQKQDDFKVVDQPSTNKKQTVVKKIEFPVKQTRTKKILKPGNISQL